MVLMSGCSMKQPMPSNLYFKQAMLLSHMDRCKQQGYIASYDYSSGFRAMSYIVNTWDFDEQKFKDEYSKTSARWEGIKGTPSLCNGVKKDIKQLIVETNNHKQASARRSIENQKAYEDIAQSLQTLGQQSQQAGQQALNSVQNMQMVYPTIPNNTTNTNALPTPEGYEKTLVPTGTVGVLKNSSISNGAKLCEYGNGRAIRIQVSQTCPNLLNP